MLRCDDGEFASSASTSHGCGRPCRWGMSAHMHIHIYAHAYAHAYTHVYSHRAAVCGEVFERARAPLLVLPTSHEIPEDRHTQRHSRLPSRID